MRIFTAGPSPKFVLSGVLHYYQQLSVKFADTDGGSGVNSKPQRLVETVKGWRKVVDDGSKL
jgi:hypothetical protein